MIRRAAELQERLAPEVEISQGVRESELVRIAVELGLQERFVRDALSDPATFATADKGSMSAMDRTLERTGPGLPGSEAFEVALDEFGPSGGIQGGPTTVGDTMTYQSMAGMSHCEMLVSKKGGRTRVKVGVNTYLPVLGVAVPLGMTVAILAGVLGSNLTSAGMPGTVIGWIAGIGGAVGVWLTTRLINRWSNRKVVERLDTLMKRLDDESRKVSQDGDGG